MLLACIMLLALTGDQQMSDQPYHVETVDLIKDNSVYDPRKPRKALLFRQFIFFRWSGGDYRIVGYMMVRDDAVWQVVRRGEYHCVELQARDGTWRRIRARDIHSEDTRHDPEIKDRRRGERDCLFGLQPFGDVRG